MRPDYSSWLNTTLWTVSSLQLLIDIGREVLSLSQTLAHQIRPRRPLRLPPISEPIQVNSTHRAPWIHPEPSSRGPGARTNDSTIETSSALQSASEQTTPHTRSEHVTTHDAGPSQPDSNSQGPNKPITRLLLYGANNEGDVFIGDMRKLARACHRHLGSHSQVDDRVVMGDIGFEFRTFFSQTNVRIQDMLVFGASGHGRIVNNLVMFRLSANINISIRDIFMFINRLPFHCTIEVFLDVCHAALAAEQHGLYKTWPPDAFISTSNLPDGAVRPRTGPKVILWTAAGRRGLAYFRRGKDSYMLAVSP
ncbi:hypothetical protein RSAG8_03216, partial [Rhizoctonia solani AG-8 WAC10335]